MSLLLLVVGRTHFSGVGLIRTLTLPVTCGGRGGGKVQPSAPRGLFPVPESVPWNLGPEKKQGGIFHTWNPSLISICHDSLSLSLCTRRKLLVSQSAWNDRAPQLVHSDTFPSLRSLTFMTDAKCPVSWEGPLPLVLGFTWEHFGKPSYSLLSKTSLPYCTP